MAEKLITLICVFLLLLYPVKPDVGDNGLLLNGFSCGFSSVGNNMSLNGIAAIEKKGLLRQTNGSLMEFGHAFYLRPIQFKNSSGEVMSFSTTFAFAIVNKPGEEGGDGLAFAISPTTEVPGGNPGSYLGLFKASNDGNNSNHIFAVELDYTPSYPTTSSYSLKASTWTSVGTNLDADVEAGLTSKFSVSSGDDGR
ncbi:L-type lectin-domain containing receptor kinase IV.1 [Morella rubra]|uniref:L-type lectin-domain containing receptor kinase IV.1 n=1 Tax=Morella rubra TaxID=262757 RepID=A0A6A1W0J1_9ROSI|nr:L-type lectin-domain containing receptor kinase IV.1 [Morella rubra]